MTRVSMKQCAGGTWSCTISRKLPSSLYKMEMQLTGEQFEAIVGSV